MIQPNIQTGNFVGGSSVFAKKTGGASQLNNSFLGMLKGILNDGKMKNSSETEFFSTKSTKNLSGISAIEKLKNHLQTNGYKVSQPVVDAKTLSTLETLMINSGFEKNQVTQFLTELKNGAGLQKTETLETPGDLAGMSRTDLIEKLKNHFLANGYKVDQIPVNEKTLSDFEGLLISVGFDKSQVGEFISGLRTISGTNELKLSNLFKNIESLEKIPEDEAGFLEISALPFIESILSALGLGHEKIQAVLSDAKVEGTGIDLNRLTADLKKTLAQIPGKGHSLPDGVSVAQVERKVNDLIKSIGIAEDVKLDGPITLEKFASMLEGMASQRSAKIPSEKNVAENLNRFMESVRSEAASDSSGKGIMTDHRAVLLNPLNLEAVRTVAEKKSSDETRTEIGAVKENKTLKNDPAINLTEKNTDASDRKNSDDSQNRDSIVSGKTGGEGHRKADANVVPTDNLVKEGSAGEKTAAASSPKPTGRTLPNYVLEQVSRQILQSVQKGENEIKLQLKPPQLGRLQMSVENTANGIKIDILTEQPSTREMLVSHANELKSFLMDQGIQLEKIEVRLASNFDQSLANTKREYNGPNDRKRRKFTLKDAEEIESVADGGVPKPLWERDGRLNLVA